MPTTVSTARQCLAGEAVAALNEAICIAHRRGHAQTTSLHVVSALLSLPSSSSSLLRDALSRSRPTAYSSSLQFKALELCFSAALDRLPSATSAGGGCDAHRAPEEPPISNSLMAAIKRSQATQRRHPDTFHLYQQQQQTSSTVKVELQQLVLSILDDPVVSRVFGEAGFRSYDIKFAILRPPPSVLQFPRGGRSPPLFLCNFSLGADDFDLAPRSFTFPFSNQPLKCDAGEENCRRIGQVLVRKSGRNPLLVGIGAGDAARDFERAITSQSWSSFPPEARGLEFSSIEQDMKEFISGSRDNSFLDERFLNLKLRLESDKNRSSPGIILSFGDLKDVADMVSEKKEGDYLKRLSYLVTELTKLLSSQRERLWLMGSAATYEIYMKFLSLHPPADKDWDLQLLPITSVRTIPAGLPSRSNRSTEEVSVPFGGCSSPSISPTSAKKGMIMEKAKDDAAVSRDDQRPPAAMAAADERGPPQKIASRSPSAGGGVSTDLMLGTLPLPRGGESLPLEAENVKAVYRSLVDKVPWQGEAAWAVSQAVAQCKAAEDRRRHRRGDIWLGLLGSDPVGKRKLAAALAESLLGSREKMISVDLSPDSLTKSDTICGGHMDNRFELTQRGKTAIDFLAAEIRRSPRAIVFLENVDRADLLLQGSLLQAVRTGRLSDSHGREVSVGNAVFLATAGLLSGGAAEDSKFSDEEILAAPPRRLKILVGSGSDAGASKSTFLPKRKRQGGPGGDFKRTKRQLTGLLDLNLPVEEGEEAVAGADDADEAWMEEFLGEVDESVVFKPFDFDSVAGEVLRELDRSSPCAVEIEAAAMEQILAAAWVADSRVALTEWVNRVLAESLAGALEARRIPPESGILRLVAGEEAIVGEDHAPGILLPARIMSA